MITRIFRVQIDPTLRSDFERMFLAVSVPCVETKKGYISHIVGYPTKWKPDEYMLLTNWTDEGALHAFAGENWNQAVIPEGMETYVVACRVDHFETKETGRQDAGMGKGTNQ